MPTRKLDNLSSSEFADWLQTILWFENIGRRSQWDKSVKRIWKWTQWLGPEDPGVEALGGYRYQAWKDALFNWHRTKRDELTLSTVWDETHSQVMRLAVPKVSQFSFDEDAWHAPTASVWSAAYLSSVIACYLVYRKPIPKELSRVWQWYVRGHWPSGYTSPPEDDASGELLVL